MGSTVESACSSPPSIAPRPRVAARSLNRRRIVAGGERARPWWRRSLRACRCGMLAPPALVAIFRCAAPARCGALADERRSVGAKRLCEAAPLPIPRRHLRSRQSVNQPGTIFGTDHWLLPKLDQLRRLLTDPITHDEAQALLDVLHQRHWMTDLTEWLESRAVSWGDFFTYRANLYQEELRKRADERDRRRAEGRDPYLDFKLFSDELFPKISDDCPDCGSSDWKPIAYGLPTEDTQEDVRRGHFVLGGCLVREPTRHCVACFNSWPTKPNMSKPAGRPESIQRQIAETRSDYATLSALADQPPSPEEPHVERAWARIDGSIKFLVSFGERKARITKTLEYARLGGAPTYETSIFWVPCEQYAKTRSLAAVAALRFERIHEPEKHNLYNDWDKVQAHRRESNRRWDENLYRRERVKENREKLSKLLKLARAAPEELPSVFGIRSSGRQKDFRVRFPWGAVSVQRYQFSLLESLEYRCKASCAKAEDPELARDLGCAAAMLAEFPSLARPDRGSSGF
jgi:hypothetical protein